MGGRALQFIPSSNSDLPSAAAKRVMKGSEASCERSFFHQCHAGSPHGRNKHKQLIATYSNTSKLVFGENCIDTSYTKKTCNASRLFQTGHFPKNLEACFHSLLSPSHPTTNPLPFHLSPRAQQPPPIIPPLRIKVASGARG